MKNYEISTCKFCQKNHRTNDPCDEQRLWRRVRDELNRTPNMDVIYSAAAQLGLISQSNANHKKRRKKNEISNAKPKGFSGKLS